MKDTVALACFVPLVVAGCSHGMARQDSWGDYVKDPDGAFTSGRLLDFVVIGWVNNLNPSGASGKDLNDALTSTDIEHFVGEGAFLHELLVAPESALRAIEICRPYGDPDGYLCELFDHPGKSLREAGVRLFSVPEDAIPYSHEREAQHQ